MVARSCKQCGKLFSSINREVCPACIEKEKAESKIVEDFLKQNPGASVMQICENTKVDEVTVLKLLKEGKIRGVEKSVELKCETCGKPLTSGRLCPSCLSKFSAGLKTKDKEVSDKARGMLSRRDKEEEKK